MNRFRRKEVTEIIEEHETSASFVAHMREAPWDRPPRLISTG